VENKAEKLAQTVPAAGLTRPLAQLILWGPEQFAYENSFYLHCSNKGGKEGHDFLGEKSKNTKCSYFSEKKILEKLLFLREKFSCEMSILEFDL